MFTFNYKFSIYPIKIYQTLNKHTLSITIASLKTMVVTKKFVLVKHFEGLPKHTDLKIVEEELPPLQDGEFLAEAIYLSVDPYMRAYVQRLSVGDTMVGTQVAKITESKHKDYPIGSHVFGRFNWCTHTISKGDPGPAEPTYVLPDYGKWPLSYALGILGMPGFTAYFAFLEKCSPKFGETVVVSGAGGAIGIIVGQIAKIMGCRVVGIAGSDEKGKYLINELGFDDFVNYKSGKLEEQLVKATPDGIDCYFDNVAGEISSTVIKHMNTNGRIVVCGSISSYNADIINPPKASCIQLHMISKQLKMSGFQTSSYYNRRTEAINKNLNWLNEKKLIYRETITNGFENMTTAFIEMLQGKNVGKAIVKV